MEFSIEILLALLAVLAATAWFLLQRKGAPEVVQNANGGDAAQQPVAQPQPEPRRVGVGIQQPRQQPRQVPARVQRDDSDSDVDEAGNGQGEEGADGGAGGEGDDDIDLSLLSKKEVAKVMKRREKQAQLAARKASIEAEKKRLADQEEVSVDWCELLL